MLGFWVALVLVGRFTDWVSARTLVEIFFVSIAAPALAVASVGMLAFAENRRVPGAPGEPGEEVSNYGQDQDSDRQGRDDGHPQ